MESSRDSADSTLASSGDLGFEARVMLHAWSERYVSRKDVSGWADQRLAEDELSPTELNSLATLSVPEPRPTIRDDVRRNLEALAAPDSQTARKSLIGVIERLYEFGAMQLEEVARHLFFLKYKPYGDEYPEDFWFFWDALDLAERGHIAEKPEELRRRLETLLAQYRAYAEWFEPAAE